MELRRREYLTNNCFRRCMLTFLTYCPVGIYPRLDPWIGRGVPNVCYLEIFSIWTSLLILARGVLDIWRFHF